MGLSVTIYLASLGAYAGVCIITQQPPAVSVVLVVSTAMFAYGASIVGLAPRSVCSTWAYFMHMPEDLVWAISGKRPFNYDTIDEHVLVGRMPRSMADIAQLRAEGVTAFITLSEDWELAVPIEEVEHAGFAVLALPTPDYQAPTQAEIRQAVDFLIRQTAQNGRTYVHCNGGKGRSAVATIAYFMQTKGMSKEEAYDFVRGKRKIANMRRLGGIMPQWKALVNFEKALRTTQSSAPASSD